MKPITELPNQPKPELPVPWRPLVAVFFVIAVYYLSQLIGGLVVYIYPLLRNWNAATAADWLNSSIIAQFIYILVAEVIALGAIYLFIKHYRSSIVVIGLRRPKLSDVGVGLLAAPVYYVIYLLTVAVASQLIPGLNIDQVQEIGFKNVQGTLPLVITFISLVIIPPIAEEIIVRGFLYSSLKKALPIIWATIMTSAIFAAAHLPEGGASGPLYIAALDTFVLSLVLIYLREKTGGLWASMTLHGIKNGVAFLALFVFHVAK